MGIFRGDLTADDAVDTDAGSTDAAAAVSTSSSIPLAGQRWMHALGSATDLTSYVAITVPLAYPAGDLLGLTARVLLKSGSTSATAIAAEGTLTDPVTFTTDPDTSEAYLRAEVSNLGTDPLTNVWFIGLVWEYDAALANGVANAGQALLTLGAPSDPGNLAPARAYYWEMQESAISAADSSASPASRRITSGGSPLSAVLTPSGLRATAEVQLPSAINGTIKTFDVFRYGGTLDTTLGTNPYLEHRLPAAAALDSDDLAAAGADDMTWDGTAGLYRGDEFTWNPTSLLYTTWIRDGDLLQAEQLIDHNQPPLDADCLAEHQGRLVAYAAGGAYISREARGVTTGLYYNDVPNPNSPDYILQGTRLAVAGDDTVGALGHASRMLSFEARTAVFIGTSRFYILAGTDNTDFDLVRYNRRSAGLIAANAACVDDAVLYLAYDGVHAFDLLQDDQGLSAPIATLLNPDAEFAGDELDATAFAQASLLSVAGRLFLSAPGAGSSVVSLTYIRDGRNGGAWYPWELAEVLCGSAWSNSSTIIIGCGDGMLYEMGNDYGDTALHGADVTAVTMSGRTRTFIGGTELVAERLGATVETQAAAVVTLGAVADADEAAKRWSVDRQFPAGKRTAVPPVKCGSNVRGRGLYMTFEATSVDPVTIVQLELLVAPGKAQ